MKQLFQAYLTWGETGSAGGHDLSAYTDEEHLSGNRKRLTQLRKKTDEMSGQFAAQRGIQIDCNPPSTAVAATNATSAHNASLSEEDEQYIESLANIINFPEVSVAVSEAEDDPLAIAAAKVASKITLAMTTEMSLAPVSPTSESVRPSYIDPNVITAELPVLNFQPPKEENKSSLSGSFKRLDSGAHKMSHWVSKKAAGTDAWDSRVESGLKAYEVNAKYTSSQDNLPVLIEPADGCSFIEMDRPEDAPAIESYDGGHVKMIPTFDNQGAGIRRLSSMRNSFKMLECRESEQSLKPVDPSNSYEAFSSFVSAKSTVEVASEITAEVTVDTAEALEIIEELLQEAAALEPEVSVAEQQVCEPVQETCEPVQEVCEPVQEVVAAVLETTVDILEESFGDLLAECYEAAKTQDVVEPIKEAAEEAIEEEQPITSFAPETFDHSIVENYAGSFSVTFTDSLSELSDIARLYDQMNFDPKSFVPQTIGGEPIEAVCVFNSEKLSFNAPETIRTELESMFNMDPLSQVDEEASEVEIESVSVVSIEEAETLEIAAVGGKPSRQRTKGTSRSKKTQTRKEKKSKKRAAAHA